jgi:hypothetical protein
VYRDASTSTVASLSFGYRSYPDAILSIPTARLETDSVLKDIDLFHFA